MSAAARAHVRAYLVNKSANIPRSAAEGEAVPAACPISGQTGVASDKVEAEAQAQARSGECPVKHE